MFYVALLLLLATFAYALPQAESCGTTTTEVIVPTSTYTFLSTYVTTTHATTAEDLGTFTQIERVSSTKTLQTVTSTETVCTASGTAPHSSTVYTSASVSTSNAKRDDNGACTITSTFTTTYGVTETWIPANRTSTYTQYSSFTQATVTTTSYGGTAYTIATATASTSGVCGPSANATNGNSTTATITRDIRCAPTAMISAYSSYGLEYADDVPIDGAFYQTSTPDASSCCQVCAEADDCAASSWDIRTNVCKLEFPVDYSTGNMNCGEGLLAFYDYGPDHPMAPGTGLYVAALCGNIQFGAAQPDDGT